MEASETLVTETKRARKAWNRWGLGASALGLACLGCCLAPVFGILLTAGTGAALAGFFRSWSVMAVLGGLVLFFSVAYLVRKSRRISCRPDFGDGWSGSNAESL